MTKPRKPGRPALPAKLLRSDRIHMRTYPAVADKVRKNGTEWLESLVCKAKDKPPDQSNG
jgi:hypothetical protein